MLVVDDDRVVDEMYRLALSRAGNDVLVANDGLAALRLALTARPDFIFLDIRMPKMDGKSGAKRNAIVRRPNFVHTPIRWPNSID